MPKRAITQLFLDRITPPKSGRLEYWDTARPGLHLRLSASGAASWAVMYRVNGKQVRETLGTLAQIPRVTEARRRADQSIERAASGLNPVEQRREAARTLAGNTVAAAVERYLAARERDLKPTTVAKTRYRLQHDVLPRWGARPLADITKADVLVLINDKATRRERQRKGETGGAVVSANRLLTTLGTLFRWAVANDLIAVNPADGVRKPGKEIPRDRALNDAELRAFWVASEDFNANRRDAVPFGALLRLLLTTAQRRGEVAGMRWLEVDLETRRWTIPAARVKNGKEHVVHLSDLALAALRSVPRVAGRDLVLAGANGTAPLSLGKPKARLDRAMRAILGDGTSDWTLHDLRRTATTGMARLGVEPHVADRVLNHVGGTIRGVAAVYNRFQYLDERALALDGWARFVDLVAVRGAVGAQAEATVRRWMRDEADRRERAALGDNAVAIEAVRA